MRTRFSGVGVMEVYGKLFARAGLTFHTYVQLNNRLINEVTLRLILIFKTERFR